MPQVTLPQVTLPTVKLPDWIMLPFLTLDNRTSSSDIAAETVSTTMLSTGQNWLFRVTIGGQAAPLGSVLWSSSDPTVLGVTQAGVVTALAAGNATVRATQVSRPGTFIDFPVIVTGSGTGKTVNSGANSTPASAFAQRVLELTNAARTGGHTCGPVFYPAVPALTYNSNLERSAQGHAADMAAKNYFSHSSQDGRNFSQRISATGYLWSIVGENIAAGYPTPETVVGSWLKSDGHCQDIMNASFKELGVGYANNPSSTYQHYWVQDFGAP